MPLYNPETQTKACSKCEKEFKGDEVAKNFFKVRAMKDGFATRCKACYYVKAPIEVVHAKADAAIEKKLIKMVEAEPIKDRPAAKKAYTHTDREIKAIEKSSGLKFQEWADLGDSWVPKFGKAGV